MRLRIVAVLLFALLGLVVSTNPASAQNAAVYPPLASACDLVGGVRWTVPGDGLVDSYEGCTVRHQPNVAEYADQIECPNGTYFSLAVEACEPIVEENLNDGWYDEFGNPVPHLGECPEGHFIWYTPDNGLDHDICSPEPEDVSGPVEEPKDSDEWESGVDTGSTDDGGKGIYPVIGTAYVVGTNGEGAICRDAPDGAQITTLPEGTQVSELADGVNDGWQMVAYEATPTSFPSCFIWHELLGTSPTTPEVIVEVVDEDAEVEVVQGPVNGPTETTEQETVTTLPSTGHGTTYEQRHQSDASQPTLTPGQRTGAWVLVVICVVGLVIARPWRQPRTR